MKEKILSVKFLESLFQTVDAECEKARWPLVLVCTEGVHSVRVSVEERSCREDA